MSRGYVIQRRAVRVSDSVSRDLSATDEVSSCLELLEVLPREQMADLLRGELQADGYEEKDGKLSRTRDGVTVTVDPQTGSVTVGVEATERVEVSGSKETSVVVGSDSERDAQATLRDALRRELEEAAGKQAGEVQRKVSGRLEAALGELSQELDGVAHRVTAEALKRKAAAMGQVKEVHEDREAGSLTIKVEV